MFQYVKEVVINDNIDSDDLGLKFEVIDNGDELAFLIRRVGTYPKSKIEEAIMLPYEAPVREVARIEMPVYTTGVQYRLVLRVKLEGDVDSQAANSLTYFNRPFVYEFQAGASPAALADAINASIKKSNNAFFNVVAGANEIDIQCVNCYQRVEELRFEYFLPRVDVFSVDGMWVNVDASTVEIVTSGTQGQGTYEQLSKNNRLPSLENRRAWGEHQEEAPIRRAEYDTFEITMNSGIRNVGNYHLVGEKGVSITTHRFFVNKTVSDDFLKGLTDVVQSTSLRSRPPRVVTIG